MQNICLPVLVIVLLVGVGGGVWWYRRRGAASLGGGSGRPTSNTYLQAGAQKLRALQPVLLRFLEIKEKEVLARRAAGTGGGPTGGDAADDLSWMDKQ